MSGINVTITSTSPGVSIGGGTSVSVAVAGPSSPVTVSMVAGGSTTVPDITQLEAGTGITISTAANQFTISGYTTAQIASYSAVKSVNGKTGTVSLQAVDVTAAASVHTHTTADVVGITALIGSSAPVKSVAGRAGVITLTTADVSGLAAIATSGSASDLAGGSVPAARLPAATSTALGAIQVGSGLSITSGVLSATGGGGPSLSDATPQALGTASAGTSSSASRADHVHAVPSAASITGLASVATSGSASDLSAGTISAARLPIATDTTLGAIKVGSGLSISSGVLSATGGGGGGATFVSVPASAAATGTAGTFAADSTYLYACYSSNQWLRVQRASFIVPPGAPTVTSSSGAFNGSVVNGQFTGGVIAVNWTAPANTGGELTGYTVQLNSETPVSVGSNVTTYSFTGVTAQVGCYSYTVTVKAVNSAGQSSSASASGVIPESNVPTIWSVTKTPNEGAPGVQYGVAWYGPCSANSYTSYQVQTREYFNGSEVVVSGAEDGWGTFYSGSNTSYSTQISSTSSQQYQFRVRAVTIANGSTTASSGWSAVSTL